MDTPARLKTFEYVTAEKAPLYRAVMRVFMDSKEQFALHLRPSDVLTVIAGCLLRAADPDLTRVMMESGYAIHEEQVLETLLLDLS